MFEDVLSKLKKNFGETAEVIGKKTENFVEIQKLKSQIHTANHEIAQNYEEMGEMIYRRYQQGETLDAELTAICEDITELKAEVASCKDEIGQYRGESTCPECGASVPANAAFCMKCGAPMPVCEAEFEEGEVVNPSDADEDEVEAAKEVAEEKAAEDDNDFEEETAQETASEEEKTEE